MTGRAIVLLPHTRRHAHEMIDSVDNEWIAMVKPPTASAAQRRRFHWLCGLAAKARIEWNETRPDAFEWKLLFISAHDRHERKEGAALAYGLEGELVSLREHTSAMTKARMKSLIDYVEAWLGAKDVAVPTFEDEPPGWYPEL